MIFAKLLPLLFLTIGILFFLQIGWPLISFQFGENFQDNLLVSPQNEQVLGVSIRQQKGFPAVVSAQRRHTQPAYNNFYISLPSIDLKDELVWAESNELDKGLVHLPGSALPGEKGNVFISGHSGLAVAFGQSGKAVFAKLNNVKFGDLIQVNALGTKFNYRVIEIKTVDPKDLSVVRPKDPLGRYLSLMTCVPPGINLKRLVVLGELTR